MVGWLRNRKDHRLNHISHMIETSAEPEYPFQPFTPVCSDIDEKTPFTKLIENILVHIQKETVNKLCMEYRESRSRGFPPIKEWCKSEDIANAFDKMGMREDTPEVWSLQYLTVKS